jgi:hypothetical protein
MQWVTRRRPKIDRLACPWLIRRFIDRDAEFLFVAPDDVRQIANATGAIPFDVPGVELAPPAGGGCSFDVFLTRYGLDDPALEWVATIVRDADNDNLRCRMPEAAGLRAISFGLASSIRDDQERVAHGLVLYDALYQWARRLPTPRPEHGMALWLARRRERRQLADLSPRMLRDIGVTPEEARSERCEYREPLWWLWTNGPR